MKHVFEKDRDEAAQRLAWSHQDSRQKGQIGDNDNKLCKRRA